MVYKGRDSRRIIEAANAPPVVHKKNAQRVSNAQVESRRHPNLHSPHSGRSQERKEKQDLSPPPAKEAQDEEDILNNAALLGLAPPPR